MSIAIDDSIQVPGCVSLVSKQYTNIKLLYVVCKQNARLPTFRTLSGRDRAYWPRSSPCILVWRIGIVNKCFLLKNYRRPYSRKLTGQSAEQKLFEIRYFWLSLLFGIRFWLFRLVFHIIVVIAFAQLLSIFLSFIFLSRLCFLFSSIATGRIAQWFRELACGRIFRISLV